MGSRRQSSLPNAGTLAPGFRLAKLEGGETTLAELTANGPVLLAFFKVTCPVCQMAMPYLERLHQEGGLRVYGISQNNAEDTREFNERFGVSFPTLLDSDDAGYPASNAYGISSVPTMFLVEADGKLGQVVEGWNRVDMESLGERAGMALFRAEDNVPAWKAG
ncbi:MAG: Redoxin domain protein [Candidatus Solibacter sp.]|jgi:peroxiredoxin|nr:Redoxin domain protein [Candidatus Solibacter sp.]